MFSISEEHMIINTNDISTVYIINALIVPSVMVRLIRKSTRTSSMPANAMGMMRSA